MIKLSKKLRNLFNTHGEPHPNLINPPLFITGCMRSGTTILVDELSTHPQLLKIGVELNKIWTEIGGASILEECLCSENLNISPKFSYNMTNYFAQFIEESKGVKRHLMRFNNKLSTKLGSVFYDWENIIPVNKSPHLINKIQYVKTLFPDSKFIFIIRDIYNQSASQKIHFEKLFTTNDEINFFSRKDNNCWYRVTQAKKQNNWDTELIFPGSFNPIPLAWIKLNYYALKSLEQLNPSEYLILNYDDLLINKSKFYSYIFNFLALNSQHNTIEEKIKNSTSKIINTTSKGELNQKWKTVLSEKELESIETEISKNKLEFEFIEKIRSLASTNIMK